MQYWEMHLKLMVVQSSRNVGQALLFRKEHNMRKRSVLMICQAVGLNCQSHGFVMSIIANRY